MCSTIGRVSQQGFGEKFLSPFPIQLLSISGENGIIRSIKYFSEETMKEWGIYLVLSPDNHRSDKKRAGVRCKPAGYDWPNYPLESLAEGMP